MSVLESLKLHLPQFKLSSVQTEIQTWWQTGDPVITINEHRQTGGFRVKLNLLQKLSRRERRVMNRIDKANWSRQSPMIAPPSIQYELANRIQAIGSGGLGVIQQMVK